MPRDVKGSRWLRRLLQPSVVVGAASLLAVVGVYWLMALRPGTNAALAPAPPQIIAAFADELRSGDLTTVAIPSAIPYFIAGMRTGVSTGFLALVAAELIAAPTGLGFMIQNAGQYFRTDVTIVGIIVIGLLGALLDQSRARRDAGSPRGARSGASHEGGRCG